MEMGCHQLAAWLRLRIRGILWEDKKATSGVEVFQLKVQANFVGT